NRIVAERGHICPVVISRLVEPHGELANQRVLSLLFDPAVYCFLLRALRIVFGENAVDLVLSGHRVFRLHVAADEILHHVARELLVSLIPSRKRLEDHTVAQVFENLGVEPVRDGVAVGCSGVRHVDQMLSRLESASVSSLVGWGFACTGTVTWPPGGSRISPASVV